MLELDGVGFAYHADDWIFRGVTACVPRGSILGLLGPNGRGKSTLLRVAAGLARPREGEVRRGGAVGFVPQLQQSSVGYLTFDMVLMGRSRLLRAYESPGRRDRVAARAALERVGIGHLADRPFSMLSGGERQLALIARAIVADCEILVLDEPVSALDLCNQGRILTLLRELASEGIAVMASIHQPEHALYVADQVAVMLGPTDVRVGPARRMLNDDLLGELYGVRVRAVTVDDDGTALHTIVKRYGS